MKWQPTLARILRDIPMVGFGAWIIWKQVYATTPNGYLSLVGLACMFPAVRSAVVTILSGPGPSSSQQQPPAVPPSPSSQQQEVTGEDKGKV